MNMAASREHEGKDPPGLRRAGVGSQAVRRVACPSGCRDQNTKIKPAA
jgi:hypothetical protein